MKWSRAATAASGFFLLVLAGLVAILLDFEGPLPIPMFALAGMVSATGGIAVYLSGFMHSGQRPTCRSLEGLKAEQQVWTTVFSGSIVWIGVFVGGVVLTASLGSAPGVLKELFPSVLQRQIQSVVMYHVWVAGWVGIASILWVLRPVHRRLYEISLEIDALGARGEARPEEMRNPEARPQDRRRGSNRGR